MKLKRINSKISKLLDLPADVLLGECYLRVEGNRKIHIENQKGILEYTPTSVSIRAGNGSIRISGEELSLNTIAMNQLIVNGNIATIEFR